MALEDRGNHDYAMRATEEIETREIPNFPEKAATSEKEELKLHLAQLEVSLKSEKSEAEMGIVGAGKRVKRLETLIESLKKKIAAIN